MAPATLIRCAAKMQPNQPVSADAYKNFSCRKETVRLLRGTIVAYWGRGSNCSLAPAMDGTAPLALTDQPLR